MLYLFVGWQISIELPGGEVEGFVSVVGQARYSFHSCSDENAEEVTANCLELQTFSSAFTALSI